MTPATQWRPTITGGEWTKKDTLFSKNTNTEPAENTEVLLFEAESIQRIFSKLGLVENFEAVKTLGFKNIEFNMKSIKKEHDTDVYREQKSLPPQVCNA